MPLAAGLTDIASLPYTVSHVIRKSAQIASFNELPKEKRPPETIWDNSEKLDKWFDAVFERKDKSSVTQDTVIVVIEDDEIEG